MKSRETFTKFWEAEDGTVYREDVDRSKEYPCSTFKLLDGKWVPCSVTCGTLAMSVEIGDPLAGRESAMKSRETSIRFWEAEDGTVYREDKDMSKERPFSTFKLLDGKWVPCSVTCGTLDMSMEIGDPLAGNEAA